jgi:serine/threonine protein phosphatase PrpC
MDGRGCTANVIMFRDNGATAYIANAGDSRSVLAKAGKAVDLSKDHKPDDAGEKSRIVKAGSTVQEGRVDGNLNLSRALGDLKYKKAKHLKAHEHPITCVPDVKKQKITDDVDFIVMGCDGMYETKTS